MTAVNYLWNPLNDNIVEEFDDAGNTVAEYSTEPEEFGNVVSQYRDDEESFFHFDGIGSTLMVTDSGGNVTDSRSYSAFGNLTEQWGNTVFVFQYVGQKGYYKDIETGEYELRRRVFQPETRWLSTDPFFSESASLVGSPAVDTNVYKYVWNMPTLLVDPSGLISLPWPAIWTLIGKHGNYCGYLYQAKCENGKPVIPPPKGNPKDKLDEACMFHDCCVETWAQCFDYRNFAACNFSLCVAADNPAFCNNPQSWTTCQAMRQDIKVACHSILGVEY